MGFNYEDMQCATISQTIPHVCPNLCVLQYNDTLKVAKMELDLLQIHSKWSSRKFDSFKRPIRMSRLS